MKKERIIKVGFLLLVVIALLMHCSSLSIFIENKFLDTQFRFLRSKLPRNIDSDVVIVGIDEQTLETYREPLALWHPHLENFFEAMTVAKPSVVGVDLILPDRSYDFLAEGYDKKLLNGLLSLKSVVPVVLGLTTDEKGEIRSLFPPLISLLGKDALGLVLVNPDQDGTIRRFRSSVQFENNYLYATDTGNADLYLIDVADNPASYEAGQQFSFLAQNANTGSSTLDVEGLGAKDIKKYDNDGTLDALESGDIIQNQIVTVRYDGTQFQMIPNKQATLAPLMADKLDLERTDGFINYSYGEPFDYIPLQKVIAWMNNNDTSQLQDIFRSKPVIIGSVLPFDDRHLAPVPIAIWKSGNNKVPGVLIHAQILRTLIANDAIQKTSLLFIYLLLVVSTLFYWIGHKPKLSVPLFGIFVLLLITVSTLLLFWYGQILTVVTASFISLMALFSRISLESVFTLIEKRRLRSSFGRYVSPNVLNEILAGNITPEMVGQRKRVCVLFSDIRSFTTRSESEPPEVIISLLNKYFNEMAAVIHSHDGTIDKFIGDGLMVFFGAPNNLDNPAQQAFSAAQEMFVQLEVLNKSLKKEDIEEIKIGVGIHVGEVVVGHVGSDARHEYTVIGDTVNLAARLEGITKELGYPIICTADVKKELNSSIILVSLGKTPIKGRAEAEVFGWKPE